MATTPTVYLDVTLGAVRVDWCDECLVSHEFVTVYITNPKTLNASPAGEYANHVA